MSNLSAVEHAITTPDTDRSETTVLRSSPAPSPTVHPGVAVEVLSNFSGRWVPGFTIVEASPDGYRLRRRSDNSVLPVWFGTDEVRIVTG